MLESRSKNDSKPGIFQSVIVLLLLELKNRSTTLQPKTVYNNTATKNGINNTDSDHNHLVKGYHKEMELLALLE